jgi:putative Ca2+/H+ antiporter (TMEM165/GDT1 family)
MDWKIFSATFAAIFLAELADKTQLVGMGMAAKSGKPYAVLAGSIAAYVLVTAISVLIGAVLKEHLKPEVIRYCGASLFVIIGILIFAGKI